MKCPNCGTDNPPGEQFCSNCGAYLDSNAADATAATNVNPVGASSAGSITLTGSGGTGGSRTLAPGARLENGRYVIEKVLGQGGMGAALLAKDTRVSNKLVVIKELISDNTDPAKRQEDVRNFEREVETLANLDHPLIPNVTDSFQEGSHYFMVQEYAAGENLEDRIERLNQPLPEEEVLTYASQVLDILDYLGQQNPPIVHRDIKPANIIISNRNKRTYLVDFGIARAEVAKSAKRKQTSALGTPGYAPPEQYQGNADPRSDLYALAATMHHLLTNRDPRNYPPFAYPSARSLNPKLSLETERVLNRALMIDINKRYQNAAAMKHDIDEILAQRFGVDNTSTFTFGTSGPIGTTGATATQTTVGGPSRPPNTPIPPSSPPQRIQPRLAQQPIQAHPQQPPPSRPAVSPPVQAQQRKGRINWVAGSWLFFVVVLIAAALFVLPGLLRSRSTTGDTGIATVTPGGSSTSSTTSNGIGVTMIGGDPVGISDGTFAFDTDRKDGAAKQQAAEQLKVGNSAAAQSRWRSALATEMNDAEALIYLEDQRVLASGRPYITFIVGTMLTGANAGVGRDNLQGAYVAQKEYNANNGAKLGGVLVRLLIANSGSTATDSGVVAEQIKTVTNQIVQAVQKDKTIVGVMGWPFSARALNAINVLSKAQIPMVSQTASSDDLSGISPYFFRVAPSNMAQATAGAQYAQQKLGAKNIALFVDQGDSYSRSLAEDFTTQFTKIGGKILVRENYTVGQPDTLPNLLNDGLNQNPAPDLIYFAGYAKDLTKLLTVLPTYTQFPNLPVMGGDALYELNGYSPEAREGFSRLRFTAFAYPDEWGVLGYPAKKPAFFDDYANAFDPQKTNTGSPYGFTRPTNNVILSYDAMLALLSASKTALSSGKTSFTPNDLQQALLQITGPRAIQGISGQIAFDANGDAANKAVIILAVDPQGRIKMEPGLGSGKFLVG